jgi:hypothetical protein
MRLERTSLATNLLLFHGLLAAPLAWSAQLVVGYGIGEADCSAGSRRWGIDSEAAELALTAAAGAIALTGLLTAAWLLVEERRQGGDDRGRIAFMAGGGVLVSAIFVALILLGGIASLAISHCHQS